MILNSHDQLQDYKYSRIFFDLKGAYDRLNLKYLIQKLRDRNLNTRFISIIKGLFCNNTTQVLIGEGSTKPIQLLTGVQQGSLLSPLLFSIYIDDLAYKLNANSPNQWPTALMFADDFSLFLREPCNIQTINANIDIISNWCKQHNMVISVKKCGRQHPPESETKNYPIKIHDEEIPHTPEYKLLGIEMTTEGIAINTFTDRITKKAQNTLKSVKHLQAVLPTQAKLGIFRAFIRSVMEYGTPLIWAIDQALFKKRNVIRPIIRDAKRKYQNLHKESLEWVFEGKYSNPMNILGPTLSVKDRWSKLAASFEYHLRGTPWYCPIRQRRESVNEIESSKLTISPYFQSDRNEWMRKYDEFIKGKQRPPPLKAYLNKHRLHVIQTQYGKFGSLIPRRSRKNEGMDMILTIKDKKLRKWAIKWRLNKQITLKCCCGNPLDRNPKHYKPKHEDGCGLISDLITVKRNTEYLKAKRKFDKNYLILDDILNNFEFDLFDEIFKKILTTQ